MASTVGGKSYSFLSAFLLGVPHKVLARDFPEDYLASKDLSLLGRVRYADDLRRMSKLKQFIFHYYNKLVDQDINVVVSDNGVLAQFIKALSHHGFSFKPEEGVEYDLAFLLNKASAYTTIIAPVLLNTLGFPHIQQVLRYFYLPTLTADTLTEAVNFYNLNNRKFPHWTYIHDDSQCTSRLTRIFGEDRNFFVTAYALSGTPYELSNLEIPKLDWSRLGCVLPQEKLPISDSTILYFDCDNTDFEIFLAILDHVKEHDCSDSPCIFKLFVDQTSDRAWTIAPLLADNIDVRLIKLDRIKDSKSVVDVAIASSVTLDYHLAPGVEQVIVSSDSDFYGLRSNGITPTIFYDSTRINKTYLDFLVANGVVTYDLGFLDTETIKQRYRSKVLTLLCLVKLKTLPPVSWTLDSLTSDLMSELLAGFWYRTCFSREDLQAAVLSVLQDLTFTVAQGRCLTALGSAVSV